MPEPGTSIPPYIKGKLLSSSNFKNIYNTTVTILDHNNESFVREYLWHEVILPPHLTHSYFDRFFSRLQKLLIATQQSNTKEFLLVYHFWTNKTQPNTFVYITEPYETTLYDFVSLSSSILVENVKKWSKAILKALQFVHKRLKMVVHNLSPHSIYLCKNYMGRLKAKLGDFELFLFEFPFNRMLRSNYCAKEFFETETSNEQSDIHAFGCIVSFMCTMEEPFSECSNMYQIYRKLANNEIPDSLQSCKDILAKEFVCLCIDSDPTQRPSSRLLMAHSYLNDSAHEFCMSSQSLSSSAGSATSLQQQEFEETNALYYTKQKMHPTLLRSIEEKQEEFKNEVFDVTEADGTTSSAYASTPSTPIPPVNINVSGVNNTPKSPIIAGINLFNSPTNSNTIVNNNSTGMKRSISRDRLLYNRIARSKSMQTIAQKEFPGLQAPLTQSIHKSPPRGHRRQKSIPCSYHETEDGFQTVSEKFYAAFPTESETDNKRSAAFGIHKNRKPSPLTTVYPFNHKNEPSTTDQDSPVLKSPEQNPTTVTSPAVATGTKEVNSPIVVIEKHKKNFPVQSVPSPLLSFQNSSSLEQISTAMENLDVTQGHSESTGEDETRYNSHFQNNTSGSEIDIKLYIPLHKRIEQSQIDTAAATTPATTPVEGVNNTVTEVKFSFNLKEDTIHEVCDELSQVFPLTMNEIKQIEKKIISTLQSQGYFPSLL